MLTAVVGAVTAWALARWARHRRAAERLPLLASQGPPVSPSHRPPVSPPVVVAALTEALARADVGLGARDAVVLALAGAGAVGLVALAVGGPGGGALAALAALAAGPGGLWVRRHRREERLAAAVPELLDEVARELRAGGTVPTALERLARRPGLLGGQAARVQSRMALGLGLDDALEAWPGHHAVALRVAVQAGGRAAASLDALAAALRDEASVRAEARAQAAQGRLSALLLGSLPAGSLLFTAVTDPDAVGVLTTHPLGRAALLAGLGLDIAGAVWMRRVVRVTPRAEAGHEVAVVAELFRMALTSGLTPVEAVRLVAPVAPAASREALGGVVAGLDLGLGLEAALGRLRGGTLAGLGDALSASAELGVGVEVALARLGEEARASARRAAEARARTVPVRLLFPLVLCVLPAFALLGVSPSLLAGLAR